MIKYNSKTLSDWYFANDNIIKVYRNGAVVFYKVSSSSGSTPTFNVCYAVVDDITQYQETEFIDVYDKKTKKWYKLNNLNRYEEYGVYDSGLTTTYYEGKLTIHDGYEYEYSYKTGWANVGEVSGSTVTLPDVPFSVNYNAKNYDANTKTLLKTEGQLVDVDAVITAGTPTVNDGYLTIVTQTRATISGYQTYFNRDDNNPNMTIISKQRTNNRNCHMFANRDNVHNWMYRCYSDRLVLHGSSEQGQITVTTQPVVESVRVDSNRNLTYNNYTDSTSSTYNSFNYGSTNSGKFALFQGYATNSGEYFSGDFYWVYMSQHTLTDEQVQQVIDYNEGDTNVEYPLHYQEKQDPINNLSFESLNAAQEYAYNNCVYDGMRATIGGVKYKFTYDEQSDTYQWSEIPEYFQVDLNSQWQTSTSYGSISDTGNYDFYQSFSNKGVHNSTARMFITIYGYTSFTFKVRNYSESNWDYVVVNNLDDTTIPSWRPIGVGSGIASSGYVYYSNSGNSSSETWYDVTFNNLDGGEHIITITYGKDGSGNQNDDRGYVAIPKNQ